MAELNERELEALESYRGYVEQRELCVTGEQPWSTIGTWFTEDAVLIDPAWGRVEGRHEIARFMDYSMAGFRGWTFPEEWIMVNGDRLVTFWWNRLENTRPDGTPFQAPGFSLLHHAGGGLFDYELDVLNIAEIGELIVESGWKPDTSDMPHPPTKPNRNVTPPRLATP